MKKMKRIISIVIMLTLVIKLCPAFAGGLAAISADNLEKAAGSYQWEGSGRESVDVYVNNSYLVSDQPAFIHNGRTMVPLRAICEALKCEVVWNEEDESILISNAVVTLALKIGYNAIARDFTEEGFEQEIFNIDVAPMIVNGRTFVPARAVAEALHALVGWSDELNRVDITMEYDYIWAFKEGLARVVKADKYGFINEKREIVVPLTYDFATEYSQGYAIVAEGLKYGFTDATGKLVVPCIYDDADYMKDNKAKVYRDEKFGYVNNKGEEFVPCVYANIDEFRNGFALTFNNGKYGFVNEEGKVIAECIYEDAYAFINKIGVVKKDGKWGCIDESGKVIVDFTFESEYDAKEKGEKTAGTAQ